MKKLFKIDNPKKIVYVLSNNPMYFDVFINENKDIAIEHKIQFLPIYNIDNIRGLHIGTNYVLGAKYFENPNLKGCENSIIVRKFIRFTDVKLKETAEYETF